MDINEIITEDYYVNHMFIHACNDSNLYYLKHFFLTGNESCECHEKLNNLTLKCGV